MYPFLCFPASHGRVKAQRGDTHTRKKRWHTHSLTQNTHDRIEYFCMHVDLFPSVPSRSFLSFPFSSFPLLSFALSFVFPPCFVARLPFVRRWVGTPGEVFVNHCIYVSMQRTPTRACTDMGLDMSVYLSIIGWAIFGSVGYFGPDF